MSDTEDNTPTPDAAAQQDQDALLAEEKMLTENIIPGVLSLLQQAEAKGSEGDNLSIKLQGTNLDIHVEEYARRALFRYAQIVAPQDDGLTKWKAMLDSFGETDPFIAGMVAANALVNVEALRDDPAAANLTLDYAETLREKNIFVQAMDCSICSWLITKDDAAKERAKVVTAINILNWENYEPPAGIPNMGPESCEQLLKSAAQNPHVRPLIEDLKPGLELPPVQDQPAPQSPQADPPAPE